jgi:hypothetical protein
MDYRDIISMLDAEIGRLEEAGRLLKQGGNVDAAIKAVTPRQQKAVAVPKKRVMSPEGRARIAEGQRQRWAATKKSNAVTPPKAMKKATKKASPVKAKKAAPKKAVKRIMSPEARARIADAQRKRWAAAKKLKSAAPTKATKKAAPKKAAKVAPVAMPETPKAEAAQ